MFTRFQRNWLSASRTGFVLPPSGLFGDSASDQEKAGQVIRWVGGWLNFPLDCKLFFFCFLSGHRSPLRRSSLPEASQDMGVNSRRKKRKKAVVAFGRAGRQSGCDGSCWRCSWVRTTRWTSFCSGSPTAGTSTSCLRPCSASTSEAQLLRSQVAVAPSALTCPELSCLLGGMPPNAAHTDQASH